VDRRSWLLLLVLAALWGASYLFIEVALEDLSPWMIVLARTALAAVVLIPIAAARGALAGVPRAVPPLFVLAAVGVAGPFVLISVGQEEITSSLAGILVSSAPLFTALLAIWVDREERSTGSALVGVGVGFAGVAVLLGVDAGGDAGAVAGALAVLLASLGYAIAALYLKRRLRGIAPLGVAASTMTCTALMLIPVVALAGPGDDPGMRQVAAIGALGVLGTGIAFVIYYTLIARVGPAKASLVAYVAPVFAVFYGVVLLDERVTVATFAGLALILAGSWLAAGELGERRQPSRRPRAAPAEGASGLPGH
jgi:drug/metabolite transporter (DMT)-like permease